MCTTFSKVYLYLLNTITAISGLAVFGVSIWQLTEYSDIDSVLSKNALWVVLAMGAAVFLLSMLGCFAARGQNKCCLFVYFVLVLVVAIGQLVGGAIVANYAGELKIDNLDSLSSSVTDFVDCSYNWCCFNSPGETCNTDVWNSDGFCKVLPDNLKSGSSSCKAGDETAYQTASLDFLRDHSRQFSIAAISLGVVELLALLAAIYLMCTKKEKTAAQREAERRLKENQQAGAIVYGSQPPAYAV